MPIEIDPATAGRLKHQVDDLCDEFRGVFSRETIEQTVGKSVESLGGSARFDDYLPILVYRYSREVLRATGQIDGTLEREVPEVLFVCVHNAGRSQMAAALLKHRAQGKVHVRSAGSAPADSLNPAVVEAMTEMGLDVSQEFPKPLTDEFVKDADVVITMGCGDACPIYPGKRYEDWELDDPAGRPVDEVRRVRDDIDSRVQQLLETLVAVPTAS